MDFKTIIEEATNLMSKPLIQREVVDLSKLTICKHKISTLIPYAKKAMQEMHMQADTAEKETILRLRKERISGPKETISEIEAKARINKNTMLEKALDKEFEYITLYQFYQDIADQIVSTRMLLKL